MDRASTVVIAAVAMSCGSTVVADEGGYESGASVPETAEDFARAPPGQEPAERDPGVVALRSRSDMSTVGPRTVKVTSTATAEDGFRYVAGVFSGSVEVGGFALESHGGDDIFLAGLQPDSRVRWARAIGSKGNEDAPKVTFADGHVTLVAMTDGAVDCGAGPLNTWSSETFFVCTFGADGTPINGGTFPTGRQ
ncbi:MAG: hypothetical protein K0S65_743 [Labilithrix sp.]|nr:hypothetical protein [Labilithrix sp.]